MSLKWKRCVSCLQSKKIASFRRTVGRWRSDRCKFCENGRVLTVAHAAPVPTPTELVATRDAIFYETLAESREAEDAGRNCERVAVVSGVVLNVADLEELNRRRAKLRGAA